MIFIMSGLSVAIYWIGAYLINAADSLDRIEVVFEYGSLLILRCTSGHGVYDGQYDLHYDASCRRFR